MQLLKHNQQQSPKARLLNMVLENCKEGTRASNLILIITNYKNTLIPGYTNAKRKTLVRSRPPECLRNFGRDRNRNKISPINNSLHEKNCQF